ncbi:Lrp/AsnC family transcriptional regulator [Candidatus Micrarchaeota archaeon]|nr:Lrp/AsnC family transcriptional regulator [Candidatus Micrarchaeota archaeon]
MDHKSEQILELLRDNSRLSSREISRKTGIPLTTVHNRIKKMEEEGIIEKYSVEVNHEKLGLSLCGYVLCSIAHSIKKEVLWNELAEKIRKLGFVESVDVITGEMDLMIKLRAKNIQQLNKILMKDLRAIEGINDTTTMVVLEEV